ncbi:AI-2E family transporter [Paraoerskovia marina]|uniref:AI-2E family transporter n=1 Tax=Paraoerskovia marina TaxID=545619 RepID=UPI0009DD6688|nr:AI-2E family transporter [Paraoerskovia marina]
MSDDAVPPPRSGPSGAEAERDADRREFRAVQHDTRRPPRWLPRALFWAVLAVFAGMFVYYAFGQLTGLLTNILISFFVMLMLEPLVVWFVRRGWRRGIAAFVVLIGAILTAAAVIAIFGNLFVQQLVQLVQSVPDAYAEIAVWADETLGASLPESEELLRQALGTWGNDVAAGALMVGASVLGVVFSFFMIALIVYYLLAAGPRFRQSICAWLTPHRQEEVLRLWEITQVKVSDFINSRVVLATFCTVATSIFLLIIDTPYALPLALFTGVVSQFVPTIGTYLGGALPTAIALTSQGVPEAIGVLVFVIAYQQVENLILAPKVTARALEMNPAVSFVAVIGFGSVFGAVGAFLSLPIVATFQAAANTWFTRHELVESHLLRDPETPGSPHDGAGDAESGTSDDESTPSRPGLFASRADRRRAANLRAAREAARTVDERRRDKIDE